MKRLLLFVFAFFICFSTVHAQTAEEFINQRFSQQRFDHDYFLEYVLFGRKLMHKEDATYFDESIMLSNLTMIEFASTLCIDQFNNNQEETHSKHQSMLNRLRKQVRGLPKSIDEINPDKNSLKQLSAKNHRTYTHQGWRFIYEGPGKPGDLAHSEKREAILRKTVSTVFGFKLKEDSLVAPLWYSITRAHTDEARCEAYCRLFYYIHLLGDCFEDETYQQANGNNNGQKIPLGRPNPSKKSVEDIENSDIITEIIWVCDELFSSSITNTETYPQLKKELKRVENDIRALYRSTGGLNSPERYSEYHKCVCELMQVLIVNVPNLLKNEADFKNAFHTVLDRS